MGDVTSKQVAQLYHYQSNQTTLNLKSEFALIYSADVDMRLKNVDLKKLSKDIDAIMKEENTKKEFEEGLSKDYEAK